MRTSRCFASLGKAGSACRSTSCWTPLNRALLAFSDDITHTYFSHAHAGAADMIYRVRHETKYVYEDPVSVSHHILRVTPRKSATSDLPQDSEIAITPTPPALTGACRLFRKRGDVFQPAGAARRNESWMQSANWK